MRVLVVEGSRLRIAIRDGLAETGYAVDVASNSPDGLWLAKQNQYDVVIVDGELEDIVGIEVIRRIRTAGSHVAILMLTAPGTATHQVIDLESGADDYLQKPFELPELYARVRALIPGGRVLTSPVIRTGDFVIDTIKQTVRRNGVVIRLSPREYSLLEYFALREGEVIRRTELWDHVYALRTDAPSNVVDVYVSYLRRKLGLPQVIYTRRGLGYVFRGYGKPDSSS